MNQLMCHPIHHGSFCISQKTHPPREIHLDRFDSDILRSSRGRSHVCVCCSGSSLEREGSCFRRFDDLMKRQKKDGSLGRMQGEDKVNNKNARRF